ncbi:copper amine oxidase N-terminal domain-containing protein [Paenibacillus sp. EC2-1]|uniref:copper amine oxidase N-terminal domain-containing protein n=1 Tax=Paenibacillus sp. EC2-1 TaxID=3388665 RepID=UPI003BEF154A
MKLPFKILTFTIVGSCLLGFTSTVSHSAFVGGTSSVLVDPMGDDVSAGKRTTNVVPSQTDVSVKIVKGGDKTEDDPTYLVTGHGYRFVPLRAVAEKMGYTVKWDQASRSAEVRKGTLWTTVQKDLDYYLYNERKPISLGISPVIINDTLFVLEDFFSEVLQLSVELEQGTDVLIISQTQR